MSSNFYNVHSYFIFFLLHFADFILVQNSKTVFTTEDLV